MMLPTACFPVFTCRQREVNSFVWWYKRTLEKLYVTGKRLYCFIRLSLSGTFKDGRLLGSTSMTAFVNRAAALQFITCILGPVVQDQGRWLLSGCDPLACLPSLLVRGGTKRGMSTDNLQSFLPTLGSGLQPKKACPAVI